MAIGEGGLIREDLVGGLPGRALGNGTVGVIPVTLAEARLVAFFEVVLLYRD